MFLLHGPGFVWLHTCFLLYAFIYFSSFIPSLWSIEIIDAVKDCTETSEPYDLSCHF
jgi:hypothetical protein